MYLKEINVVGVYKTLTSKLKEKLPFEVNKEEVTRGKEIHEGSKTGYSKRKTGFF